jgi:hypothetical protein
MEEFVFSGNRRRWPYLRPILVTAVIGGSAWVATCCWALLKSPSLPDLSLGSLRSQREARSRGTRDTPNEREAVEGSREAPMVGQATSRSADFPASCLSASRFVVRRSRSPVMAEQ